MHKIVHIKIAYKYFVVLYCLFTIFVFPISLDFGFESSGVGNGNLYWYTRLGIIPIGILGIIKNRIRSIQCYMEYIVLSSVIVLSALYYRQIPTTTILLFSAIILYDTILSEEFDTVYLNRAIKMVSVLFLIQILVMTVLHFCQNGSFVIICSAKDRNYVSYFLMIFYFLIREESRRFFLKKDIILLLVVMTFSRTGFLAVVATIVIKVIRKRGGDIKWGISSFCTKYPVTIYFVVFLIWILISNWYIYYFQKFNYVYYDWRGFDRFKFGNLFDYSNYIRTYANIETIRHITPVRLFLGYSDSDYLSIVFFKGKLIFPHNQFLVLFVKGGILFAYSTVRRFASIFKGKKELFNEYVVMLIYAMILGPGMYYGMDMILFVVVTKLVGNSKAHNLWGLR